MRDETEGKLWYGVNRIVQLSPEQIEISRRSGSRIFVSISGESVIDTMLFQTQRPIEKYIDVAARAIALSELKPYNADAITLRPVYNATITQGVMQQYLQSNCWLQDDNLEAYDLFIELEPHGIEELQGLGFTTVNAKMVDGFDDNPIIFQLGIEELGPELEIAGVAELIQTSTQANEDTRIPGGQGRVKDPETDGRTKQNRQPQLESARVAQEGDSDGGNSMSRQHGKPGRVRIPHMDMRRKEVRELMGAPSAGR